MIYVKDKDGKYKTLKELSQLYKLELQLLSGRYQHGKKSIEELIKIKHHNFREDKQNEL